jgi:hypothetical protein
MTPEEIAVINAYSIIVTAVSTIVLAAITVFYAVETHKMRIDTKAPMLSIQCDYAAGEMDVPRRLFLYNYGPVAQNVTINAEVKVNDVTTTRKKFLYSIAQGERTEIVENFYDVKDKNGIIIIKMKYYDAYMKQFRTEIIVDFNEMTPDRVITVPELPLSGCNVPQK